MTKFLLLFLITASAFANLKGEGQLTYSISELEKQKLDVLFVLDNSGSMSYISQPSIKEITKIIKAYKNTTDVNFAFINSSEGESHLSIGLDGSLHSDNLDLEDLEKSLLNYWTGKGAATETFYDNLLSVRNKDHAFFRSNSRLKVIYITDEDDQSHITTEEFMTEFKSKFKSTFDFYFVFPKERGCNQVYDIVAPKLDLLVSSSWSERIDLCSNFSEGILNNFSYGATLNLKLKINPSNITSLKIGDEIVKDYKLNSQNNKIQFYDLPIHNKNSQIKIDFKI